MLKNATLRQLKVFEAVARNLSFTRASEELYLTQPTVSIQLKQLTEIIGRPLFEQVGKRIFLTETGRELLKVCLDIFDSLSRFEMLVSDMNGIKAGKLRVAIITTAKYFVPRMLGLFCERYPGIDVSLKVTNRERVQQRIDDNLDDLYVLGQPPDNTDVEIEPFLENPLIVLAHRAHPLAGKKNISPQLLTEEYFLMREQGSGIRLATEQFFRERGLKIKVRMELGSNEAIKHSVAGKLGIAVLSAHTLAIDGHNEEFAMLDVEGFPIRRHWYMAYPKDKHLSVVALAFLKFMHEESKILGEKYLKGIIGFPTSDFNKR